MFDSRRAKANFVDLRAAADAVPAPGQLKVKQNRHLRWLMAVRQHRMDSVVVKLLPTIACYY